MSVLIALDFPIDLAGTKLTFVPVRPATYNDYLASQDIRKRKPDTATINLVREISSTLQPNEVSEALVVFDLMRRLTGLPFAALVQIQEVDQVKFRDYLTVTAKPE